MADGKVNVIYEDNHIIVVEKPRNILVQADDTNDIDLLTIVKNYLKEKYHKPGNVYLGLVHRLDRPSIRRHNFQKTYLAVFCGKITGRGSFEDYLKKDEKHNITRVAFDGKYAKLDYMALDYQEGKTLVKINLVTGRSHQIRVQFSSRNLPLWGDQKYNTKALVGEQIALWAYEIRFEHPISKEVLEFRLQPKNEYPWNIYKGE